MAIPAPPCTGAGMAFEVALGASFGAIYQWYLPFNASIEIEAVRGLYMKHLRSSSLAKNSKYYSA